LARLHLSGHAKRVLATFYRAPLPLTVIETLPEITPGRAEKFLRRIHGELKYSSVGTQHTWARRFTSLDEVIAEEIHANFDPNDQVHIHDMAASSGITSVELFERLAGERQNISLHCSDFYDRIFIVSLPNTPWRVIFNRALTPVQFVWGGFAISPYQDLGVTGRALLGWLRLRLLPIAIAQLTAALHGPAGGETAEAAQCVKMISLFHPRCEELARTDPRFTFGQDDFYAPRSRRAHIVRLMNALHPGLPAAEIGGALTAIHSTMYAGGILVLGTIALGERGVSIYRRSDRGFVLSRDIGGGSFWHSTIDSFAKGLC
jgi:hypothetical protein